MIQQPRGSEAKRNQMKVRRDFPSELESRRKVGDVAVAQSQNGRVGE
jgi:hypothetical protein